MLRALTCLSLVVVAACSSSSSDGGGGDGTPSPGASTPASDPNARTGQIDKDETWKDGTTLNGIISIASGVTVTIPAGATIKASNNAQVYVVGTLKVLAADKHAKITGTAWGGIAVDKGGVLDADGLDVENAHAAIQLLEGAKDSTLKNVVITSSVQPFGVSTGTKLTVTDTKATVPDVVDPALPSVSNVFGTMIVGRLDYDAKSNEGISVKQGGTLDMVDSWVHGKGGHDMVSAYGAKLLKISYSRFSGAHCGLHVQPSESFLIDHVTSDDNIYGITIYQSGGGPNTVSESNFTGLAAWLDFAGDNGPITFDNVYTNGQQLMAGGPPPTVSNSKSAPISDAKPR